MNMGQVPNPQSFDTFYKFCKKIQNEKGIWISSIRSDHGGEFENDLSQKFREENRIHRNFPPPTTIAGHHEPLLLNAELPYGVEHFNRSGILRIHLKDSVENKLSILSFIAILR